MSYASQHDGPAVSIRGLRKRFGATVAVDGVDLDIPRGSFYGLVGPNGAGKTTMLSMVTGLLRPDAGAVSVGGVDVWSDPRAVKAGIGVLPDGLRLLDRLTGAEMLLYVGLLPRMPREVVQARSAELLDVLDLARAGTTLVGDSSAGMRKKIALAAALLHAPRTLFLDEPFEAVDPVSARTIQDVLHRLTASGATVVFSSHVMDLVERLCDSVAILAGGRVVAAGPLDEVRQGRRLEDTFLALLGSSTTDGGALPWLASSSD